jgi:hypothetical protein
MGENADLKEGLQDLVDQVLGLTRSNNVCCLA